MYLKIEGESIILELSTFFGMQVSVNFLPVFLMLNT